MLKILLFITLAQASIPVKECAPKVQALINSITQEPLQWTLNPAMDANGDVRKVYVSFLSAVESKLRIEQNRKMVLFSYQNQNMIKHWKINTKNCNANYSSFLVENQYKKNQDFNDKKLQKLILKNNKGLIYVWSPHMPLSWNSLGPLLKVAKEKKLKITVLVDQFSNPSELKKVVKKEKIPKTFLQKNKSQRLSSQGSTIHYPNLYVYKDGKLLKNHLLGAKSINAYKVFLKNIFRNNL